MDFMAGLPDGFFDLVVADPPYGIFGTNGGGVNPLRSDGLKKKRVQGEVTQRSMEIKLVSGIMLQMIHFL